MLRGPPDVGDVPVGRLVVVFYIVVTLLPLICLINGRHTTESRPDAVACFRTEVEMLQQLAPSVGMARHVLSHMQDIIGATKAVIQGPHSSSSDAYPFNIYPKSMDTATFIPPEPLQDQNGLENLLDELLADQTLLDIVALPPEDTSGLWVGDSFSQPWMGAPGQQ